MNPLTRTQASVLAEARHSSGSWPSGDSVPRVSVHGEAACPLVADAGSLSLSEGSFGSLNKGG